MSEHVIETVEELRSSYGEPSERAVRKSLERLDRHCRRFIELSPFVVLASAGADGRVDCSPRGDPAGFVAVLDDRTDSPSGPAREQPRGLAHQRPREPPRRDAVHDPGGGRDPSTQRPRDPHHRPRAPRAARGQPAGAAKRPRRRGRGGLPPVHQGPRSLPPLGRRDAGGPQGRPCRRSGRCSPTTSGNRTAIGSTARSARGSAKPSTDRAFRRGHRSGEFHHHGTSFRAFAFTFGSRTDHASRSSGNSEKSRSRVSSASTPWAMQSAAMRASWTTPPTTRGRATNLRRMAMKSSVSPIRRFEGDDAQA